MANGKTNLQNVIASIQAAIADVTVTLNGAGPSTPAAAEAASALRMLHRANDDMTGGIDSLRKGIHALA